MERRAHSRVHTHPHTQSFGDCHTRAPLCGHCGPSMLLGTAWPTNNQQGRFLMSPGQETMQKPEPRQGHWRMSCHACLCDVRRCWQVQEDHIGRLHCHGARGPYRIAPCAVTDQMAASQDLVLALVLCLLRLSSNSFAFRNHHPSSSILNVVCFLLGVPALPRFCGRSLAAGSSMKATSLALDVLGVTSLVKKLHVERC